ncbi:MAG TPA: hypothetical protein VEU28_10740 [Actinomycetota bacterium]|nr:hypothetical protein [Actinomycetota bacterium]HYO00140.1 hypothetical protein [Actinomycetota bacterium]
MKSTGKKLSMAVTGVSKSSFPRRLRGELQLQDRMGNVLLRTSVRGSR